MSVSDYLKKFKSQSSRITDRALETRQLDQPGLSDVDAQGRTLTLDELKGDLQRSQSALSAFHRRLTANQALSLSERDRLLALQRQADELQERIYGEERAARETQTPADTNAARRDVKKAEQQAAEKAREQDSQKEIDARLAELDTARAEIKRRQAESEQQRILHGRGRGGYGR